MFLFLLKQGILFPQYRMLNNFKLLEHYIGRTHQSLEEMLTPLNTYNFDELMELVQSAENTGKKVVFFFKTEEDQLKKCFSCRFE